MRVNWVTFLLLLLVIFHNIINAFEWYTKECCTSQLYFLDIHTNVRKVNRANTLANRINAAQDGRVGCNIIEHTKVFLYLDWLYCPWHGTNFLIFNHTILPDTV